MPDIKTKPKNELKIKKFDGATIYKQKLKNNLVSINSKTNNIKNASNEENNEIDYGTNQIEEKSKIITNRGIDAFNKYGQKSVLKTKNNIQIAQNRINKKAENNKIIKTKENITNTRKAIYKIENKTKKTIIKVVSIFSASAIGLCALGGVVLYNIVKSNVNYTEQQAKEIALSQVPGQVVYVTKDIDLDHLGLEYNIKIKDKNNIIREVTVDSKYGAISDFENYYYND